MKKELFFGIFLLAIIIAGIGFLPSGKSSTIPVAENGSVGQPSAAITAGSSGIAGRISHNLAFNSTITNSIESKAMEKTMIHKTIPPMVSKERTLTLAKKFNMSGNLRGETVVQSEDLRYGLEISRKSGSVRYQDQDRPNDQLDVPEKLPSDDEAIKIATKFLKDRDLYPEGAGNPIVYRENVYGGKDKKVFYGQIGVWYHRKLNGMDVDGTQLVVYVAGSGDVIGYYANWRDYEPYKEFTIRTPFAAFEKLKTNGVPIGSNPMDAEVSIDNIHLAYQTTPGAYSEKYLEPVWVFKGNVTVDGKPVMPVEQYIPALTEESAKSLSS
jgi:hypothetical protein